MPSNAEWNKPWPSDIGPNSDQLAKYAAEERAKLERQPGDAIEDWTIIDQWWTEDPIRIDYRSIERDGQKVTQRLIEGLGWRDHEPPLRARRTEPT